MKLKIPQENANDDFVTVTNFFFKNGSFVNKGDLLLEFETSKATIEYEAPTSGILSFENLEVGSQIEVNTVFAELLEEVSQTKAGSKISKSSVIKKDDDLLTKENPILNYSDAAIKLKDKNISIKSSNRWVTSKDFQLKPYLYDQKPNTSQAMIMKESLLPSINFSKKEITSKKNHEINALKSNSPYLNSTLGIEIEIKQKRNNNDYFFNSVLDLVIYETTLLLKGDFSDLNACFYEGNKIANFEKVIPGFALDDKNNLTVASIPEFKTLHELKNHMVNIIVKFDKKKLTPKDLKPSTFTVTDLSSTNVNFILPLINGYQTFIIGICKSNKGYQVLGTFDHRVTEGKRFAEFLDELKRRIQLFAIQNFEPLSCYFCLKTLKEEKEYGNRGLIKIEDFDGEKLICRNCFEGV
jgi:pyruvate dehydrogenase E2 component (dihydrolipoamide acetyltransferase)